MKIVDFIRLILKHIRLLILLPLVLAILVIILTINPSFEYSSQTVLYTGLATGTSIEMDKRFNYQANSAAFDNLINIIKSRETQEEVAIRLLAQHLMLPGANEKYMSEKLYKEFKAKIPDSLYNYVATDKATVDADLDLDHVSEIFPSDIIDPVLYEQTVKNLMDFKKSSTDNFIYEILNYDEDDHYSLYVISQVKPVRIGNSDLVKLSYTVNDPGICQQTLDIYNKVCIKNYKYVKENRSDAVVKYFEAQLADASAKLKSAEDELLDFNKESKIINYYEQSKAVAQVKEGMVVDYNKKKAELVGLQAETKRLEKKLDIQEVIQQKSSEVLDKKKKLGELNYQIAMIDSQMASGDETSKDKLEELKRRSDALNEDIKTSVDELYSYQNTVDGLPVNQVLPTWMDNVAEVDNLKAKIKIIEAQSEEFQKQYATYAPAGANMTRIQREISVAEQGYLEILHGLNLAKLKLQDNALSANLKAIDPPYFPLSPIPSKRKILIIVAAVLGGIITLGVLLAMEYFDDTLRNAHKAEKVIGIPALGMIPKILLKPTTTKMAYVQNRLVEMITQNILQFSNTEAQRQKKPKTILCFSMQKLEGKSVLACNIAKGLKKSGKRVLVLNYTDKEPNVNAQRKHTLLNKILGYKDPRIDLNSPFLKSATNYLTNEEYQTYKVDKYFHKAQNYQDILDQNGIQLNDTPDYIIIELQSIIDNHHPTELFSNSDLDILVCRANRLWSKSDEAALNRLLPFSESKMKFIINGVELKEVEAVLGDLPKKRTSFRKKIKTMFRFQFFSKSQI